MGRVAGHSAAGRTTTAHPDPRTEPVPDPTAPADARRFGYWAGHLVVVGSMIGAGILTTSGYTLRDTGNPAALLGAVGASAGVLALCGAVTVAELATALPRSGGDYVFVREAFGRGAGFVSGWATFALGFAAPDGRRRPHRPDVPHRPVRRRSSPRSRRGPRAASCQLGATALILVVGVDAHASATGTARRLQTGRDGHDRGRAARRWASAGCCSATGDWGHLSRGRLADRAQWPALAIGLIYVGYAYAGWNGAAYLAGEIRDPARTLPRCLVGGTVDGDRPVPAGEPGLRVRPRPGRDDDARPQDEVEPVAELAAAALFGRDVGARDRRRRSG